MFTFSQTVNLDSDDDFPALLCEEGLEPSQWAKVTTVESESENTLSDGSDWLPNGGPSDEDPSDHEWEDDLLSMSDLADAGDSEYLCGDCDDAVEEAVEGSELASRSCCAHGFVDCEQELVMAGSV